MSPKPKTLIADMEAWRDQYNPLRGLTIARAVALLESMYTGDMADLQWTYSYIEETDPTLLALVERRTSAIDEMHYAIKIVSEEKHPGTFDKKLAEDQQATLARGYERIDNVYEAIVHLAMATFRKHAHLQMHLDGDGTIAHLEPLDQWNWVRQGSRGAWYWNPEAKQTSWKNLGEPVDPERDMMIIREAERHVNRYALIKFVRASLSEKDWDGFIELYGIPKWLIIEPPDVKDADRAKWRDAAADMAGGGSLPHGSDAKSADPERGTNPFEPRLQYLDQKLVLAGTGGLLTMLAAPGSGTLAGNAHQETFKMLAASEARRISELFQRTLDRRILDAAYPDKPRLAYFDLLHNAENDVGEVVDQVAKLANAGYQVDADQVAERTGYRIAIVGPPAAEAQAQAEQRAQHRAQAAAGAVRMLDAAGKGDRETAARELGDRTETRLRTAAREALGKAMAADLKPLRDRIAAALANPDDQAMIDDLNSIPGELPEMLLAICSNPKAERVLESTIGAALLNGLAEPVAQHADVLATPVSPPVSPESPQEETQS